MSWKLAFCKLGFHDFAKWRARATKRHCRRGCGATDWKDIDVLERELKHTQNKITTAINALDAADTKIRQAPGAAAVMKPGAQPGVAE